MQDDIETLESPIINPSELQQAAADLTAARTAAGADEIEETERPEVGIAADEEGMTPEDAAEALSSWRDNRAADVEAFNRLIGLDQPGTPGEPPAPESQEQPPPQEQLQQQQEQQQEAERDYAAEATRHQVAVADQQVQHAVQQLQTAQVLVSANFQSLFPDVKTENDLLALASTNPARYQQALEHVQYANEVAAAQNQIAQAVAQENAAIFQNWAAAEDDAFDRSHPELADPSVKTRIGNAAATMLREVGLTDNELRALWNGHASINLRDKRAQDVILDAVRYREARQAVKQSRPDQSSTRRYTTRRSVQTPGSAPDEGVTSRASVKDMEHRLKNATGMAAMDAAVELLQAQRRSRG
jgi:hypothetical protein